MNLRCTKIFTISTQTEIKVEILLCGALLLTLAVTKEMMTFRMSTGAGTSVKAAIIKNDSTPFDQTDSRLQQHCEIKMIYWVINS